MEWSRCALRWPIPKNVSCSKAQDSQEQERGFSSAFVVQSLREQKAYQEQEKVEHSWWDKRNFVFTTRFGASLDGSNLSGYFAQILKEQGLRRVRFHVLRHSFASLALQAGSDMKVVSEQLGHSQIGITLDLYSHVSELAGSSRWPPMYRASSRLLEAELRLGMRHMRRRGGGGRSFPLE